MEEENKDQHASDPNPNAGEEVKQSDLDDNQKNPADDDAKAGDKNDGDGDSDQEDKDGQNRDSKKQNRKTDAEYAKERRERKAREEAERKKREAEIRRQAVFEVKSGQVTADELKELGLDKVEDEDQLFLVESLRKAKADGVENPEAYAYQSLFKKQSKDRADAKAKADAEEEAKQKSIAIVAKDQANFKAKFGKTTADVINNEPEFMNLFGHLIDKEKGNFTDLYSAYTAMKQNQNDAAKKDGGFPMNQKGPGKDDGVESEEDFKKRYIATYGHW